MRLDYYYTKDDSGVGSCGSGSLMRENQPETSEANYII
jgi:hypothetical protein